MSNIMYRASEDTVDALDELLDQLLKDFPEVPSPPFMAHTSPSLSLPRIPSVLLSPPPPPPASSSSLLSPSSLVPYPHDRTHDHDREVHPICQWISTHGRTMICGSHLSKDPKQVCLHFRSVHNIRGNEKEIIPCHWRDCHVVPMQRGSLIRHVLTVHLGLMKSRCERCKKVLSRKGTGHMCVGGE